jgi:branched-chain amino acid aminotransferase
MLEIQLFVVSKQGPLSIAISDSISSIHDVLTGWPIGAYTVLRTYQHYRFLSLDDHLARLEQAMSQLGWDENLPRSEIKKALHIVCSDYPYPDAQVRIDLLADDDPRMMRESKVLITLAPFESPPETIYRNGVLVGITSELSRQDPAVKSAKFVIQRRQYLEEHPDLYEVLLLDREGFVREGASSNFYGIRDGELWTASEGILPGTTRQIILEIASRSNIGICSDAIHQDDIQFLDEAAISSSSRGIVPVIEIDGMIIGSGRPGEIISRFIVAYRNYVIQAVKPAV